MTITEFLLARIAEDEYWSDREITIGTTTTLTRMHNRVLAECVAKRAIVAGHELEVWSPGKVCGTCCEFGEKVEYPCDTLKALAAVYKDHPDYPPGWAA